MSKTLRIFLQSAILGLGAWLVMQNQMTPGGIIAGTILLGRALAPIETALNQWPVLQRGWSGWNNLAVLLGAVPSERLRTALPEPLATLMAKGLTVVPPGERRASLNLLTLMSNRSRRLASLVCQDLGSRPLRGL